MNTIDELIQRYLDNKINDEERAHLMRLIRSGALEQSLKKKIEQTFKDELNKNEKADADTGKRGEEIFNMIIKRNKQVGLPEIKSHDQSLHPVFLSVLKYAAVFLVLVIGGVWFYTRQVNRLPLVVNAEEVVAPKLIQVVNNESDTKSIALPDGSTIALEPGSQIRYAEKFGDIREVYLTGDAFFEVEKDASRPFLVYANEVTTRVLGTSFRVKANAGEKEIVVAVKTGKVTVIAKSGDKKFSELTEEVTLTPNQQAIYKRIEHVVLKQIVDAPEVISTQAAIKNSYVNEPVVLIFNALSKSYGVDIQYDREALSGCTLTSDVLEGEGLYEQLEIVCSALGGKYRMESDASIVVEADGCLK